MVFFCQAEDGIGDGRVTGVQTCALPIYVAHPCDAGACGCVTGLTGGGGGQQPVSPVTQPQAPASQGWATSTYQGYWTPGSEIGRAARRERVYVPAVAFFSSIQLVAC